MAISHLSYRLYRDARRDGWLPTGGSILEFGEANWYNDVDAAVLLQDIDQFITSPEKKAQLQDRFHAIDPASASWLFDIAHLFYDIIFEPSQRKAIDLNGTPEALQLDLTDPLELGETFDICINNGTAEHVFDIANFFRTMHKATRPGGLMFHEAPMTGWLDHGFYNFQPTFFFDLAAANAYQIIGIFVCDLKNVGIAHLADRKVAHRMARDNQVPDNANLFAAFRKSSVESVFRTPQQAVYDGRLDAEEASAWSALR
ncbi:MAG: hypothetical protein HQL43_04055 [Alphaproteobacteria bacterium]|nr:hypothetical protein [Alphaproteobacteria bacterium]